MNTQETMEMDMINTDLKIGDRVNVALNISEKWQSAAGMANGVVARVDLIDSKYMRVRVRSDSKTKDIDYHRRLYSGTYCMDNGGTSGYTITKV